MSKKVDDLTLGRAPDARGKDVVKSASVNGTGSHFWSARLEAKGWQVVFRISLLGALVGVLGLSCRPAAATIIPPSGQPALEAKNQGAKGSKGHYDWWKFKWISGGTGGAGAQPAPPPAT